MEPTYRDAFYGDHERDRIDLYQAKPAAPCPVYVFIHGGGFAGGDKSNIPPVLLESLLAADISVATVNYPLSATDPFPAAIEHTRRAIQFIRWKAEEWNLDGSRIAAGGGSAGAGLSMLIGFQADGAEPESEDPVRRQSTRLTCVACWQGQCSYDPHFIRTIISGPAYAHDALQKYFRVTPEDFDTPEAKAKFRTASAINFLTADAPPVFIWFRTPDIPMDAPPNAGQGIHHPKFGRVLKEKMDAMGVECVLRTREDLPDEEPDAVERRYHGEAADFVKRKFGID